jgi:hypothetical protein
MYLIGYSIAQLPLIAGAVPFTQGGSPGASSIDD